MKHDYFATMLTVAPYDRHSMETRIHRNCSRPYGQHDLYRRLGTRLETSTRSSSRELCGLHRRVVWSVPMDTPLNSTHRSQGFGGGCAHYAKSMAYLNHHQRVYAIDWLGSGNSSRPTTNFSKDDTESVEEFFIESLEQWRERMGFDRFLICGHSLGKSCLINTLLAFDDFG